MLKDGIVNLKQALTDLLDEQPADVDQDKPKPIVQTIKAALEALDWRIYHLVVTAMPLLDVDAAMVCPLPPAKSAHASFSIAA